MPRFDSPLNNLSVASPCSAPWNEMYGDERKRFCGDCKLNVYNLSGMTTDEAEALVMNAEGRLCVRFYPGLRVSVVIGNVPQSVPKKHGGTDFFLECKSLSISHLQKCFLREIR